MIADEDAIATVAVKDLKAAKKFYGDTLGLKLTPVPEPEVLNYKSGNSTVLVYKSQFAGSNKATSVTWIVDDVEGTVKDLKAKGITFEHYDFPGMTRKGDVHIAGKSKAAWFKDPDGNILAVVSG
jgi:catechol 2,3-dioxygenase-like lactoylglutathione lyase family enzyme